jgi:hypothetical protein
MGKAWTCGCRGGKIIPLRPGVKVAVERRPKTPTEVAVPTPRTRPAESEQLSLFDEPSDQSRRNR